MSVDQHCGTSSNSGESGEVTKRRSKPWGQIEEKTLIKEVLERENVLFGTIKGCGTKTIHQVRMEGWQEVADILRAYVLWV